MTPEQVSMVEETMRVIRPRLDAVADDFYRVVFAKDPDLRQMFGDDLVLQRQKFADELGAVVSAIRDMPGFVHRARMLGARHGSYGVRSFHYRGFRDSLLEALGAELGEAWTGEVATAWRAAYDMVAEAMMMGAPRPATSIARR